MAGLVEQLQADAMNGSVPISDLLRKAKTVAVKLRQDELVGWLDLEMSGYKDIATIPSYRRLGARTQFLNPVMGWCPVVGGEALLPVGGSVAEIAGLLTGDSDTITTPAPMSVVKAISEDLDMQVDARRVVSKAAMAAILEEVRNQIHDWALRLEQAGVHGEGLSFSPTEAARAQSVVVNIGNIANATGIGAFGDNASISAVVGGDITIMARKVLDLVSESERALPRSGLPKKIQDSAAQQLAELKEEASGKKPSAARLKKGLEILKRIMEGAAGNLIATGIGATIGGILSGS